MKVLAFAVREDEKMAFEKFKAKFNLMIDIESKLLTPKSVELAKGYDMITFLGNCDVNSEVLEKLHSFGIKYIASRSTGYDNIDLLKAKELGMKISNSTYSPYSVAEFTVMLGLMMLKNIPLALSNVSKNNFSLKGLMGREIRKQTIGIIGNGKIGKIVAKQFKALGANVLVYDLNPCISENELVNVPLNEVFEKSDIISLHLPLTNDSKYLINDENIKKMKTGVIIINTARGELIDGDSLLKNLKNGKIGGAALDTLENEIGIFHKNCNESGFKHRILKELLKLENVCITPHQAFYTDQAVSDMVESALENLYNFYTTGDSYNNLIK